jgi:hypothetical protein
MTIEVLEPRDVFDAIKWFGTTHRRCKCLMLDPWYNKGVGGVKVDYQDFIGRLLEKSTSIADHIFLWGFPEILAGFVGRIPETHKLTAWLTWYYKNNPSVIRGWRSSQNACLHLSSRDARLYPEHFLNEAQLEKKAQGKLRYMPGPASVIEAPLSIGFVNRAEQLGHPSPKPMMVYEPLIRMTTVPGDLVFDPMCGAGTTGTVCRVLGRSAILSDISPEYVEMTRGRLENEKLDDNLRRSLSKAK